MASGMPALTMANNADFVRTFEIQVGAENPVAYDLTGHTVTMEVRSRPEAAETFISIDSDTLGGITIESPATLGQFTIKLPLDRLIRMPRGDYHYDVVITRADNFKLNLGINTISVAQGITR